MRLFLAVSIFIVAFVAIDIQISYADHLCREICEPDGFSGTECWLECAGMPVISNVSVTIPDYCVMGPSSTVNWDYSDPSGSPQSAYQVQINYQSAPGSPAVDSGKISCSNCDSYFGGQGILRFNTTYRARVRVWNGFDIPSPWRKTALCTGEGCKNEKEKVGGSSWQTPVHAYPNTNSPYKFTWSPTVPSANGPVRFTDRTLFDALSTKKQWSWTFVPVGNGSGSSDVQNPVYTFGNSSNTYQITEKVRDDSMPAGRYCASDAQTVNILRPAPIWRETRPR